MRMPPIVNELLSVAAKPRYSLMLWDLALENDGDECRRIYKTAFNTGQNARTCFCQLTGTPESELEVVGDSLNGKLVCNVSGMEAAIYKFFPLAEISA